MPGARISVRPDWACAVVTGADGGLTTPDAGDEATDSDVAVKLRRWDGVMADSAVVDVVDGQHTVVDIGLVTAQP